MKYLFLILLFTFILVPTVIAQVCGDSLCEATEEESCAQDCFIREPENNSQTITINRVNISDYNGTDITQCSFYTEGASCDEIRSMCQTEVTQILIDANFALQAEINILERERTNYRWNRNITWFSVGLAMFTLAWMFSDMFRRKKKEVKDGRTKN